MTYLNNAGALRMLEQKHLERAAATLDPNRSRECLQLATRYGQLASASDSVLTRLIKDHTKDEDCTPDPATDLCIGCGVHHGEPCAACGGKAFHRDDCPIYIDQIEWSNYGRLPNWNMLNIPLGFALIVIVLGIAYGIASHFSN